MNKVPGSTGGVRSCTPIDKQLRLVEGMDLHSRLPGTVQDEIMWEV